MSQDEKPTSDHAAPAAAQTEELDEQTLEAISGGLGTEMIPPLGYPGGEAVV
ncbi:MAG: hypothetical protein ACH36H_06045 [Candidatus Nanopelagicales bacterium]